VFISLDDNHFLKPVEVGAIVNFIGKVVYTEKDTCIVRVDVQAIDPSTGRKSTTNVFHFAFSMKNLPKKVVPETYEEAMLYIEGRRIYEKGFQLKKEHDDQQKF
jgi:acyl-coenzyme A thioesterase 9